MSFVNPGDEMIQPMARRAGTVVALAAVLIGCQNPESMTNRGPTKAPGDTVPVLFIHSEQGTAMRELGQTNRPRGEELAFAEPEAPAAPAAAPAAQTPRVQLPPGVTQAMVDDGKKTFDASCFACHGQGGAGGPLAPALNDGQWLNIDGSFDALVQVIANGVPQPKQYPAPMPPKGGAPLNDQQVRAVAAYVYSISR
jgi:mono/diheme cytochrome c family protein